MKKFLSALIGIATIMAASPAFALSMQCPFNSTTLITAGGTAYTTGATGSVGSVGGGSDLISLTGQGCVTNPTTQTANGIGARALPLTLFKLVTGTTLPAAATTNVFGYSITLGTSDYLIGEAAQGNTKTDTAIYDLIIPETYVAGQNLIITVNANLTGTGTNNASTVAVLAYLNNNDGTQGANISATSATAITAGGADVPFTITGTTLTAGAKLTLKLTTATIESGNSNTITARVGSVRLK